MSSSTSEVLNLKIDVHIAWIQQSSERKELVKIQSKTRQFPRTPLSVDI